MTRPPLPLLALFALGAAGCATSTPQSAVKSYGEAIAENDPHKAYDLLSPRLKARVDKASWLSRWNTNLLHLQRSAEHLRRADQTSAQITAKLTYSEYDTLRLRLTEEGWKITGGVLNVYGQSTPQEALVSFVRAVERKRYDLILRFIPSDYAQHMTPESLQKEFEARAAEISVLLTDLKANLRNPIEERGDRAYLTYGHRQVRFVLEGDAWKIEDPG